MSHLGPATGRQLAGNEPAVGDGNQPFYQTRQNPYVQQAVWGMTAMRKDGRAGKPKGLSEALPTKKYAAPKHYMLSALSKQWDFHGARATPASHS